MDEYQGLATIAKVYGIEHEMLTPEETLKIAPILNRDAFVGALHSPGDGIIDPTMLCNALTKLAIKTSNAQVIEDCSVKEILTEQNERGVNKIIGLRTEHGEIETNCVVNATGVWGRGEFLLVFLTNWIPYYVFLLISFKYFIFKRFDRTVGHYAAIDTYEAFVCCI